jgi:hypothetical protein
LSMPDNAAPSHSPARLALLAFAAGAIVAGIAGFALNHRGTPTATPGSPFGTSSPSAAPSGAQRAGEQGPATMLAAVDKMIDANGAGGTHVATGRARVLGSGSTPSSQDTSDNFAAGNHSMTVYCVGSGHLVAIARIGSTMDSKVISCTSAPQPVVLWLNADGGSSEVRLTAVDQGAIAVGYFIDKSS